MRRRRYKDFEPVKNTPKQICADLKRVGKALAAGHQITIEDLETLPRRGEVYSELRGILEAGEIIVADDLAICDENCLFHVWNSTKRCVDTLSYLDYGLHYQEKKKKRTKTVLHAQLQNLAKILEAGKSIVADDLTYCSEDIRWTFQKYIDVGEPITEEDLSLEWRGDDLYHVWNPKKRCVETKSFEEYIREKTASGHGVLRMPGEQSKIITQLGRYLDAAELLGIEVPARVLIDRGEIFWQISEGQDEKTIVEVRVSGLVIPETIDGKEPSNSMIRSKAFRDSLVRWSTDTPPQFVIKPSTKRIACNPTDAGRNWEAIASIDGFKHYLYAWDLYQTDSTEKTPAKDDSTANALPLAGHIVQGNTTLEPPSAEPANLPAVSAISKYVLHTSQEVDAWERAACDGRSGTNWQSVEQKGVRVYQGHKTSHHVELGPLDGEECDLDTLETLTMAQDADCVFTMLYVVSTLAPPSPLPANHYAGGWIELDDVAEKIGWYPSKCSTAEREEMRARIWRYLLFGERAKVIGNRTGRPYRDTVTGKEIPTEIRHAIWRIHGTESPLQRQLFDEVPRRVELVISKEWEPLLSAPALVQYLPSAEALGSLPSNKVAGDWARATGLVLARRWRRAPQEALSGQLRTTRRELLTTYTPKTRTVGELLSGNNPIRAIEYYRAALGMLCDSGLIAREAEAARSSAEMLSSLPRKGWGEAWLNEAIDIRAGALLVPALEERANARPPQVAKTLKPPGRRRKQASA